MTNQSQLSLNGASILPGVGLLSTIAKPVLALAEDQFRQILGLQFFTGGPAAGG